MHYDVPDDIFYKIQSEYESKLVIPKNKPKNQFFIAPIGLVGAGKTTVLKPLAERLSLIRVCGDDIKKILKENGYGFDAGWEIGKNLVEKYANLGYSIANDADCVSHKTQDAIERTAKAVGAKMIWIHINPPEEFIINKLINYHHTWLFKDDKQAIENYIARKDLHKDLRMKFIYTFDTSRSDLEKQLMQAEDLIRKETVN